MQIYKKNVRKTRNNGYLFDNIGDLVPLYRCFGTDFDGASSGASRPLGGAAPLGVFHGVTPSAVLQKLSVP